MSELIDFYADGTEDEREMAFDYLQKAARLEFAPAEFKLCKMMESKLSTEDYLIRLAKCSHTSRKPEIRKALIKCINGIFTSQKEDTTRLKYIAGENLYGFVCTTEPFASYDHFRADEVEDWTRWVSCVDFYLTRREQYQRAALTWILVAQRMEHVHLNRDVIVFIAKMVWKERRNP